ncbi:hypothetical protein BKA93DRAFT_137106 [Sparassis latifolia]
MAPLRAPISLSLSAPFASALQSIPFKATICWRLGTARYACSCLRLSAILSFLNDSHCARSWRVSSRVDDEGSISNGKINLWRSDLQRHYPQRSRPWVEATVKVLVAEMCCIDLNAFSALCRLSLVCFPVSYKSS